MQGSLTGEQTMSETKTKHRIKCYLCGKEFDSIAELGRHDLRVHLQHKRDETPKSEEHPDKDSSTT